MNGARQKMKAINDVNDNVAVDNNCSKNTDVDEVTASNVFSTGLGTHLAVAKASIERGREILQLPSTEQVGLGDKAAPKVRFLRFSSSSFHFLSLTNETSHQSVHSSLLFSLQHLDQLSLLCLFLHRKMLSRLKK